MAIGFAIVLLILAIIAIVQYKKYSSLKQTTQLSTFQALVDQTAPDTAVGFGYKCMWFAIKSPDKKRIAEILGIKNSSDCNWQVGIDKAYGGSVFIAPTVDGWTLACGWGLPHGDSKEGIYEVKNIVEILSKEFTEAQFFCTHRVTEYHCWIKAINGHVERVYSYSGETGENVLVEGHPTEFEQTIQPENLLSEVTKVKKNFVQGDLDWANEELLMQVAENWSLDPTQLGNRKDIEPGLGLVGNR